MGRNAVIYADLPAGTSAAQVIAAFNAWTERDEEDELVERTARDMEFHECKAALEVQTTQRFFSPDYPRGHWPSLLRMIRWLQAHLPGAAVYYGPDDRESATVITEPLIEQLSTVWKSTSERSNG